MGIYIKGMDMPIIEMEWTIRHGSDGKWYAIDTNAETSDGEWHEIIPVPPHGDLIDVEAFLATQREIYCENCERRKRMKNGKMRFVYDVGDAPCRACNIRDVLDALEDAPTIIEAEEEI